MKINRRLQALTPSLTLAISAQAKKLKEQGVPVIGFGAGEPDFDTPDFIKEAAIQAIRDGFTRYTEASGTLELRKAIAQKLAVENQLNYSPQQVVVSSGAKHTLYNIMQALCDEGDEVLIPGPYWLSYPEMVKMAGAVPVIVPTTEAMNYKLSVEQLRAAITPQTRMIILNSPSNPTGMVYSRQELEALAQEILRHDIWIVSDEIYEHIIYDGRQHVSIASISEEVFKRTIVVNGHSKAYAMTGWRIGYMAGPQELVKVIDSLQSHSTSNPCSIAQKAAYAALTGPQDFLKANSLLFQKRRDRMMALLADIPGFSCPTPEGAFYAFVNISHAGRGTSLEVTEGLLKEAHVAVVPGITFGDDHCLRLSYAMDEAAMVEGLTRIAQWVSGTVKAS